MIGIQHAVWLTPHAFVVILHAASSNLTTRKLIETLMQVEVASRRDDAAHLHPYLQGVAWKMQQDVRVVDAQLSKAYLPQVLCHGGVLGYGVRQRNIQMRTVKHCLS